jgi:exodeoxyribonuclease VII large subunit
MPSDSADAPVLSVAEVTRGLSDLVEAHYDDVRVEGEISDFTQAASGHCYFTLKDADAQIRCVMWRRRTRYVQFQPEEGMLVRIRGKASVYERRGDLQIMARSMQQAGTGARQEAYEALKRKLKAEGLFDAERKAALPAFPETVGVVTSGQGAALQDILSVLARRFPPAAVVLRPVPVQGMDAPGAIAEAVADFNRLDEDHPQRPEVLIVGRGGGSTEDLWAFNEEAVARALADSSVPVVSAVGHESDVSIADFVADERAATPSMAAEIVVPDRRDVSSRVKALLDRLRAGAERRVRDGRRRVERLVNAQAFHRPLRRLEQHRQTLDDLARRLEGATDRRLERASSRLDRLQTRLAAADPEQPLRRGYAYVGRGGRPVRSASALERGDRVTLRFADGGRTAEIVDAAPNADASADSSQAPAPTAAPNDCPGDENA